MRPLNLRMSEMSVDISELNEKIAKDSAFITALRNEVSKAIVGQNHMVDSLLIGLLAKGHILLEGGARAC